MRAEGEILFFIFIFQDCIVVGEGWLKLYLFAANHLYLVNKEYFFIFLMYYEKKQMLCGKIRRALKELI